jgi:hypothetical protein
MGAEDRHSIVLVDSEATKKVGSPSDTVRKAQLGDDDFVFRRSDATKKAQRAGLGLRARRRFNDFDRCGFRRERLKPTAFDLEDFGKGEDRRHGGIVEFKGRAAQCLAR